LIDCWAPVDHLLDVVHDKVLRPIIMVARVLAYGFVIVLAAVVLVVVLVIGSCDWLDIYAFHGREWLSYVAVGAASTLRWHDHLATAPPPQIEEK